MNTHETTLEELRERAEAYAPSSVDELRLTDPEEVWAMYVGEHSMMTGFDPFGDPDLFSIEYVF